jgi:hypothetical protein
VAYATAELRLRRPHGQPLGNLAESGVFAGAHDGCDADPRLNGSPKEDAVASVCNIVMPPDRSLAALSTGNDSP